MQDLINMVNNNIQLCNEYIQNFTPGNKNAGNLTDAERIEMKEDALEDVDVNNQIIEDKINDVKKTEERKKKNDILNKAAYNAMFFKF